MSDQKGYSFGTLQGVFIPSLLTILGVIMYLRFGWVLGNAGLILTLVIVTIATSVTLLTSLSLSSLVTNSKVGSGGAYYVISRSLGVEAGAAIGVPLYCAQALSITFYVSGFAESFVAIFPSIPIAVVSVITIGLILFMVITSASLALKSQLIIFGVIVASLLSFFLGGMEFLPVNSTEQIVEAVKAKSSFWTVFAVFFPAVTGITAGLGMSGDLKTPAKSLTWGTLAAVGVSYVIYMIIPVFFYFKGIPEDILRSNSMIMVEMARWKWLVIAGIWGATISSAIGSLLAAPRTMQALATDKIIPSFLGKGYGKQSDPHKATVLTFLLALVGVFVGDLNVIAPILSMFFLTTYGLINLSAAFEGIIGSPWWRPTFKVHWYVSFVGFLICFATMMMIDPGSTFIAIIVSILIYMFTKKRDLNARWVDVRGGITTWFIQKGLTALSTHIVDERTWRPNVLVFSGSPASRWNLVTFASALTNGRGIMTTVSIVPKDTLVARINKLEESVTSYLVQRGIESFVKVFADDNFSEGAQTLLRSYGFGPLKPNTAVFGNLVNNEKDLNYIKAIFTAEEMDKNIIIVSEGREKNINVEDVENKSDKVINGRIDVWWNQSSPNAGFLLTLAYMMTTSVYWERATLNVKSIITNKEDKDVIAKQMKERIDSMRLGATLTMFENFEGKDSFKIIEEESMSADFVLMGLPAINEHTHESYLETFTALTNKTESLPPTAFVMSNEEVSFGGIEK